MAATAAGIAALPSSLCKTVYFIRHGRGFHNDNTNMEMWCSWDFFDAHLTSLGWAQAKASGEHLRKNNVEVDLIVASPLIRTLETAAGVFGQHSPPDAGEQPGVWMTEVQHEEGKQSAMRQIGLPDTPIVAHEDCRETIGVNPCDRRRTVSEAKLQFPGVNFDLIETDEDERWKPDRRETDKQMQERAMRFAKWLTERPEKVIGVVSHCDFLHAFFVNFGQGLEPSDLQVREEYSSMIGGEGKTVAMKMHQHFDNCEVRSLVLVDAHSSKGHNRDPHHFPGGRYYASHGTNGKS